MTASTFWADAPRNRHSAERMGRGYSAAETRDAFTGRRRTTLFAAAVFLLVNAVLLAALLPTVVDTIGSLTDVARFSAPQN